jgi:hypothetical protein
MSYVYDHFYRALMSEELAFSHGPGPGEPMPHFELQTAFGPKLRKQDFVDKRPLVLVFGSITCPMTAAAMPLLKRLHAEHGDRVGFAVLYVREAHPGDRFRQPHAFAEKLSHARALAERDRLPFPVAVDDIEGLLHRSLDPKPNAAYFMDDDGRIAYRALWASDERAMREGIEAALAHRTGQSQRRARAILGGVGAMDETLAAAGDEARRDARREMRARYALGRIARAFKPLPPQARAAVALSALALGAVAIGVGLGALLRRARR